MQKQKRFFLQMMGKIVFGTIFVFNMIIVVRKLQEYGGKSRKDLKTCDSRGKTCEDVRAGKPLLYFIYMNMKYLVKTVLVSTLLLCACDKGVDYPITLYASELSRVSEVRLFTSKKEIFDSDVIKTFVGNYEYFELPTTSEIHSLNETISFISADSALFEALTTGFTVKKDANQFLFYSSLLSNAYLGDIVWPLLKYTDELVSVPPTYGFRYLTKEVRVGYGSYRNLEICFFSYVLLKYEDLIATIGRISNEFNEEAINTLQLRDTLAIQEYRVRFIAK